MTPLPLPPDDAAALNSVADFLEGRAATALKPTSSALCRELAERLRTAAGLRRYVLDRPDRVTALIDGIGGDADAAGDRVDGMSDLAGWLVFAARNVGEFDRLAASLALALSVGARMEVAKADAAAPRGDGGGVEPFVARAIGCVAQLRGTRASGTAFCIGIGEWLTAEHVISGETTVRLFNDSMPSGVPATVRTSHAASDVALLDARVGNAVLPLAHGSPLQGTPVWAFGYGLGQIGLTAAVRNGVIAQLAAESGLSRIRTTAATNPGDSGGPLLNSWGEVVGMHQAHHKEAAGAAYALAAESLRELLPRLRGQ